MSRMLPDGVISRNELQMLTARLERLLSYHLSIELSSIIKDCQAALAAWQGWYDDQIAVDARFAHVHRLMLENRDGWSTRWLENTCNHDKFSLGVAAQYLYAPDGRSFSTGRWRVRLGSNTVTSRNLAELRSLAERYCHDHGQQMPPEILEGCVDRLFSQGG